MEKIKSKNVKNNLKNFIKVLSKKEADKIKKEIYGERKIYSKRLS